MMLVRYWLLTILLTSSFSAARATDDVKSVDELLLKWTEMIHQGKTQELLQSVGRYGTEYTPLAPPLVEAASVGNLEMVEGLLKLGADVNHRDKFGQTALHVAMRENHAAVVSLLLEAKADCHLLTHYYYTPLEMTFKRKKSSARENFLEYLRKKGRLTRTTEWQIAVWKLRIGEEKRMPDKLQELKTKLNQFVPEYKGD